ncbi:MAG: hypothetical protein AABW72_05180 [archaeon]
MSLQKREKQILEILQKLPKNEFSLIGGYAVNAYTLPRFSIDCDLVLKDNKAGKKVSDFLIKEGFFIEHKGDTGNYKGNFIRMKKENEVKISFDLLIGEVLDRITGISIPATLIFKNSKVMEITGKANPIKAKARIVEPELLFLMKCITGRKSDIRDILMLAAIKLDKGKIGELNKGIKVPKEKITEIKAKINEKQFKNALEGVYGRIEEKMFENTKKRLERILDGL